MSVDEQFIGRFVISLKTTGDRCLILLPCSPGSLRNLPIRQSGQAHYSQGL